MKQVGVRALKQNASAVVAEAAAGEKIVITDRGKPVAQLLPLAGGGLRDLERAGLVRRRRHDLADVAEPVPGAAPLSDLVITGRDDERSQRAAWYLDTSAAAKLVVAEAHSAALRTWALDHDAELVACDLIRTELLRAARRLDPALASRAQAIVDAIDLVPIPRHVFRAAGLLDPPGLRTLDALHLAAALELGDDLDGVVTYDERMADAARARAITVVRPV